MVQRMVERKAQGRGHSLQQLHDRPRLWGAQIQKGQRPDGSKRGGYAGLIHLARPAKFKRLVDNVMSSLETRRTSNEGARAP